jgi:hypothetical protein
MTNSAAQAKSLPNAGDLAKIIFKEAGAEYAQYLASSLTELAEGDESGDTYNNGQTREDSSNYNRGSIQITVKLPQASECGRIRPKMLNDLLGNSIRRLGS